MAVLARLVAANPCHFPLRDLTGLQMRKAYRDGIMGWFDLAPTPAVDERAYTDAYPYYAELCAISELRKNPGFGAALRSGVGGHCLLYLNGVRLDRTAGYPVLERCPPEASPGQTGAGISVNSHYKNANWVAFEGADFLWHGLLKPGEALTRSAYARTQQAARERGDLTGVEFHPHFFRDKPKDMPELDFMYEISVATDYAVCFGRDTYRARVPLDAQRMGAIVDYLNALNAPYRAGRETYVWRLFNDNCVHVVHNALAAAGIWKPWPTGQLAALAMFKFPVPKNAFVDLMRRTNDLNLADPAALFKDRAARRALLETGTLPAGPGALAITGPAIRDNEVYDTRKLRLIFFDNPFWGAYRFRFAQIFSEARYFDMDSNMRHFEKILEQAARNAKLPMPAASPEQAFFSAQYASYIATTTQRMRRNAGARTIAAAMT
jgi:hypothetical protein